MTALVENLQVTEVPAENEAITFPWTLDEEEDEAPFLATRTWSTYPGEPESAKNPRQCWHFQHEGNIYKVVLENTYLHCIVGMTSGEVLWRCRREVVKNQVINFQIELCKTTKKPYASITTTTGRTDCYWLAEHLNYKEN
jgi:hypothetical protein